MRDVTIRTRMIWLSLVAVAWAVLGIVNMAKGRLGLGVLYLVLAAVLAGGAMYLKPGRRAR